MTSAQDAATTVRILVLDNKGHPVNDLQQSEFRISKGKDDRPIQSFRHAPLAPMTIGFLIDISRSTLDSREALHDGLSRASVASAVHPGDSAFVVTFATHHDLACPITSDIEPVSTSLNNASFATIAFGATSLYDTIYWASSTEFFKSPGNNALIVLSDMEDNSSDHSIREAVRRASQTEVSIFPIVLPGNRGTASRVIDFAERMGIATGGTSFSVRDSKELSSAMKSIRSDMEALYTLTYSSRSEGKSAIKIRCTRKGTRISMPHREF